MDICMIPKLNGVVKVDWMLKEIFSVVVGKLFWKNFCLIHRVGRFHSLFSKARSHPFCCAVRLDPVLIFFIFSLEFPHTTFSHKNVKMDAQWTSLQNVADGITIQMINSVIKTNCILIGIMYYVTVMFTKNCKKKKSL